MKHKMMRLITTILIYTAALVPSTDGMANAHVIRRGNSINEPDRTFTNGDTARGIVDEQPHTITEINEIIRQRRIEQTHLYQEYRRNNGLRHGSSKAASRGLKSQKSSKSKKSSDSSNRHNNIFIHDNKDGWYSGQKTNHTTGWSSGQKTNHTTGDDPESRSSIEATELTHMRMTDMLSQHTSIPIERNVATYVPIPTPIEIPTQAPARLPTRYQNDANLPTRTGVSEPIDIVSDEDPCDEMDERETNYNQYQVYDESSNIAMNTGSEQSGGDSNNIALADDMEVDTDQGVAHNGGQIVQSPVSRPALKGDDEEEEVGTDQETVNNEQIIEDSMSRSRKEGTWKYALLAIGCVLIIAFGVFFRYRSTNPDIFDYKGGKDNSEMLEPIDNTIPLDLTGGKSGYSEMNSTKSFTDYEEAMKGTPDGSVDFALFERHDPRRQAIRVDSPPISPLDSSGSRSLYESAEEGNIDDYDDDEYYDDEIEDEHVIDEESGDDEYIYDYELEGEEHEETLDELDMEESTLSWEEEEYLSTIDEERSGDWTSTRHSDTDG